MLGGGERGERKEEQKVLSGLLAEFREVETQLEEQRGFHGAVKETTLLLMELSVSEGRPIEPDSLDRLLGDLFWWGGESNYSGGTLSSVMASGQLAIITNERLKDLLAEWPRIVGDITENERNEIWEYREGFKAWVREHANVPQIANQIVSEPGSDEPWPVTLVPEKRPKTDHWPLVQNPEFHNLLVFRLWTNDDLLVEFDEFEPHLDEILALLEAEVER